MENLLSGRRGASKPRWIGAGLMCLGLGSLVYVIPHFASPVYRISEEGGETQSSSLCGQVGATQCEADTSKQGLASFRFLFILGQLLHGAGAAPLITLGVTFMEESVSLHNSPIYISVFQASFIVGPALGYVLGGQLLTIHTDFLQEIVPSSSLWVGAWWPGFLVTFAGSFVIGLVMICYPSSINRKRNTCTGTTQREGAMDIVRNLLAILKSLFSNPVYLFVSMGIGVDGFILGGLTAFLPKYIEEQFQQSAAFSAQIVGLLVVPAGVSAALLGGWIMKRLRLAVGRGLLFICSIGFVNIFCLLMFLFHCPTLPYVGLPTQASPELACSAACLCPPGTFDPVCGSDGQLYLSPCLAGCRELDTPGNFSHCSCITDGLSSASRTLSLCNNNCNYFTPLAVLCFCSMFFGFLITMPEIMTTLGSVKPEEKSMAVGLQTILARLIGGIPGPIIYGYFIDKTCILWDENPCGG